LESWIAARTKASKATVIEYRRAIDSFLHFLGARADRALTALEAQQIDNFKLKLADRVAPSTVNKALKALKASFNGAVAKRQLDFSPAEHVEFVVETESNRRPFAPEEITKLLNAAKDDWKTMVLLGYYTGQRLRDCAGLTFQNVDLLTGTLQLTTQKTKRDQCIPIAEPLLRHLNTLAGDTPDAPLCPALRGKKASQLSAGFYQVMVNAGLAQERSHKGGGKGRDGKRDSSRISFHSLRYNCTSALKSAGVGDSVAMDIVGHETAAVSRNYTKIPDATKREAINKLPDILKGLPD
jgi:integrase